jgi:hypothetical protein
MNPLLKKISVALLDPRSIILGFALFNFILVWLWARHLALSGIACVMCPWYDEWSYLNEPSILLAAALFLRLNRWWGNIVALILSSYLIGYFVYLLSRMSDPLEGLRNDWRIIRSDYPYFVGSWDSQYLFALIILCCSIFYLARTILRRNA